MTAPSPTDEVWSDAPSEPMPMRSSWVRRKPEIVLIPIVVATALALWQVIVKVLDVEPYILPAPSAIAASLADEVQSAGYWMHIRVTSQEILLGYALGCSIAFLLGLLISQSTLIERAVFPLVVAFETVPKIALAPLFVVWFGFGLTSKVVVTALVCFFPMLVNVIEGLRSAKPAELDLLASLGASKAEVFRFVRLPSSLPFVFAALDIGIVLSVIGAVVGEFVGAEAGLGYQLLQYNYQFRMASSFAVLVTLSVMGLTGHYAIRMLQRRLMSWEPVGPSGGQPLA